MIATTIEQSKHLLELGLDPKTADMFYFSYGMFRPMKLHVGKILEDVVTGKRQWAIPAWSLSALLEVMPSDLYYQHRVVHIEKDYYSCIRSVHDPECEDEPYGIHATFGNTAVESAYKMVCWLFEQGLIKKGGKDE